MAEDVGQLEECRVKWPHGKDTSIRSKLEIRSDVLSIVDTFEFPCNGINDYSQLRTEPGELLSLTSPVMFSGRPKLTKLEFGWKSTPRESSVLLSHLCEAVDIGFSVVMTSSLRERDERRRDVVRGKLHVRPDL